MSDPERAVTPALRLDEPLLHLDPDRLSELNASAVLHD